MNRVCQFCYHVIGDHDDKLLQFWDKSSPTTHGICKSCNRNIYIHGHDEWCDMTEGYRTNGKVFCTDDRDCSSN